ncbi:MULTISPECIES: YheC/YheD family endospore coat-associated protein [Paenibacillus]|uniref:YheC/YheD family endospore coat-associated protein n=1 Tax=Paenibacillus TaxID=44249 RepID=UPI0022B8797A|nr:YheC/YheD family protein [Paenibacillus caseinilyticus]MCZ8518369.1 YheC/YheD family protein [Paenibacillus caseinilyticus]
MSKQLGILTMYLSGRKMEELSFFRKLCVTGRKLGLEVLVFTPDDVDEDRTRVQAMTYDAQQGWVRRWCPFPPLIYDRCRYHGVDNFRKLTRFRKRHTALRYLSRPLANKWTMHQTLSEHEQIAPHMPATVRYRSVKDVQDFLKGHSVVYMKPKSGTGGRGIVRLQRMQGGEAVLLQGRDPNRRILPSQKILVRQLPVKLSGWKLEEKYIIQQGIPLTLKDGRVHDFRMLVQKDGEGSWQVTGCAGRIGPRRSVTSNLHGGGTAIPMETLLKNRFGNDEKVASIKKTAYALGLHVVEHLEKQFGMLCEVGIDLAVDPKGQVWLLEVNPKPSREVFSRIGERETYRLAITRPLEFALWLYKQKISGVTR